MQLDEICLLVHFVSRVAFRYRRQLGAVAASARQTAALSLLDIASANADFTACVVSGLAAQQKQNTLAPEALVDQEL